MRRSVLVDENKEIEHHDSADKTWVVESAPRGWDPRVVECQGLADHPVGAVHEIVINMTRDDHSSVS